MKKRLLFGLALVCAAVGLSGLLVSAQTPPVAVPVIVVLSDDARLDGFAASYRPDERAAADPTAWGYLNRGVAGAVQALERRHAFRAEHVYSAALRGFSARLTARQITDLENDPTVAYVEVDGTVTIVARPGGGGSTPAPQVLPWGIDRLDADLSSTVAGDGTGAVTGVNLYIIDTGIAAHQDLNIVGHVNFAGGKNTDCNGHGTHVAGTAAARDNAGDVVGVAPGARLTGVKVLSCNGSGTTSGVIKGIDWVTANAVKPAAANMSLGGGASQALDDAVKRSADSGVFYALAAGNDGVNACNSSPARAGVYDGVLTTAATASNDTEAAWSNFGPCVDLWAPGVNILSTKMGGGTTTMSGTSMASPHSAGTGALYLSGQGSATPAAVENALKAAAPWTGTVSKDGRQIQLLNAGGF